MNYLMKAPTTESNVSIQLPASKSISNRILIMNALADSAYPIENLADSDDTNVMVEALNAKTAHFDINAAGTAMRFLTAFLACRAGEWSITGSERMQNRPIKLLVDALNRLGARIEYLEKEGYPPLKIYGHALQGGEISLSGGVSSQYISALLMVAPLMENGLVLHLEGDIISRPYINLTIQLMKQFGVTVNWEAQTLTVSPQAYKPKPFRVEADWSAASYWYQIVSLWEGSAEIELLGLFKNSLQGDSAVADLFADLGVATTFTPKGVRLKRTLGCCAKLVHNFVEEPDLAQTFVVTCACLNIPFRFTGLQSLKIKETDRIEALKAELRKLGYLIQDTDNSILEWSGERCAPEAHPIIATYEDHRMAMAFAPVALICRQGLEMADPHVVSKSYPSYWDDVKKAGFAIEEVRLIKE